MSAREVFYFGDGRNAGQDTGPGHYLLSAEGVIDGGLVSLDHEQPARIPWSLREMDHRLATVPDVMRDSQHGEEQPEGIACLHHRDGWTAISFWDRTGDERGGTCSILIVEGVLDTAAMLALFAEQFPRVWARITSRLELRAHPRNAPPPAPRLRIDASRIRIVEESPVAAQPVQVEDALAEVELAAPAPRKARVDP